MMGDEELFGLIGEIYQSAGDPNLWPETLRSLSSSFGGHATALITYDKLLAKPTFYVDWNLDPAQWARYVDYYHTRDPMTDTGSTLTPGTSILSSELLPGERFFASEWYNDFLAEQDIGHLFVGSISNDQEYFGTASVFRSRSKGDFDLAGRQAFEKILPHLRRALDLQQQLGTLSSQRGSYEEILNRQSTGIILLDDKGRAVFLNTLATQILNRNDGLALIGGHLSAARHSDTERLNAAVRCSLSWRHGNDEPVGTALRIDRTSDKAPYCLTVSPLRGLPVGPDLPREAGRPSAVVFVRDPQTMPALPGRTLSELYGLTKSEARLAMNFLTTSSLKDTAERLGITKGTARQTLKQIFQKTETHSQAELIKLLCRCLPPDAT